MLDDKHNSDIELCFFFLMFVFFRQTSALEQGALVLMFCVLERWLQFSCVY